jgi:hypothetical protein
MRRIFALVVAVIMLANVSGQVPPTSPTGGGFGGGQRLVNAKRSEEPRIEIEFKGGKPEDLLAAMEKVSGYKPNVIIHPEARSVVIPSFSLHGVTPSQVFNALNMLDPGEGAVWQSVESEGGEIWTLMPPPRAAQAIDPLTGLPTQMPIQYQFGQAAKRAVNKQCRVYNLTPVLDDYTVEDVTTAVKGAWELMNITEEPPIKYHKDTKLLIVFGDPSELGVVQQVITELSTNVRMKQASAKTGEAAKSDQPQ